MSMLSPLLLPVVCAVFYSATPLTALCIWASACVWDWRRNENIFAVDVFVFAVPMKRQRKLMWILANANFNIFVSLTSSSTSLLMDTDVRVSKTNGSEVGSDYWRCYRCYLERPSIALLWILMIALLSSVVNANFLSATNWLLRWK